jgi:UDP-N-acetylmuramoylalanine--D-glutamate ligase
MEWREFFKGKKITVMGLGLLGRGLGDARFLAEQGAELIVTDMKSPEALASSVSQLSGFKNVSFTLGKHELSDFRGRDFILKAAGVPLDSPFVAEARRNNIPIEMSTSLFAAFTPATVVGVTGTRGKSTVTHLLHEILSKAAPAVFGQVFLGGNVRGVSTLPLLTETKKGDVAVLELDSWQLQGFAERRLSPHVAVFTTFLPDHLNYYKAGMGAYFADKAAIFHNQKPDDILVVGEQVAESQFFKEEQKAGKVPGKIVVANADTLPESWQLRLPGAHNRYNAGLALAAARALGVPDEISRKAIEEFAGVPGRLQLTGESGGVSFYNDTTATTPDATCAALAALDKNVVLIMGGADKGLDMSGLLDELPLHSKNIILLPGTGTDRIMPEIKRLAVPVIAVASMSEAVAKARALAKTGDKILLSPGFTSFGLFANEFDRGDQFNAAVAGAIKAGFAE